MAGFSVIEGIVIQPLRSAWTTASVRWRSPSRARIREMELFTVCSLTVVPVMKLGSEA